MFISMQKGKDNYIYGGWWSVWWTGTYSMILSKAAFFHKKYLKLYTDEMPASIKEYITRNRSLFIYYHCRLFKCFHHFMHVTCFINILTPVLDSPGIVKILQCHFLLQMQQVLLPYGWKVNLKESSTYYIFFVLFCHSCSVCENDWRHAYENLWKKDRKES